MPGRQQVRRAAQRHRRLPLTRVCGGCGQGGWGGGGLSGGGGVAVAPRAPPRPALPRLVDLGLVERAANGHGEELRLTRRGRFLGGGVTAELLA